MSGRAEVFLLGVALLAGALEGIQSLDERVQAVVQAQRTPRMDRVMQAVTSAARPPAVLGVLLAGAVFGGPLGQETARAAVLALIPTNLAVEGLKRAVNRTRPDGERRRSNASFPSSHAANAFTLAWVLARRWRRGAPLFLSAAAAVAWSRMYLNRHFLSDVLVGALIGVAAAWLMARWWGARARRAAMSRETDDGSRSV